MTAVGTATGEGGAGVAPEASTTSRSGQASAGVTLLIPFTHALHLMANRPLMMSTPLLTPLADSQSQALATVGAEVASLRAALRAAESRNAADCALEAVL